MDNGGIIKLHFLHTNFKHFNNKTIIGKKHEAYRPDNLLRANVIYSVIGNQ